MRVLQVTPFYEPSVGGVETAVRATALGLQARGIDVDVLTADPSGRLPGSEVLGGVRVRRVAAWPRNGDQVVAPGVVRAIAQGDWDVIHVQCYHTFLSPLAMVAAARSRTPYVLTFHGGGHTSRLRGAVRDRQLRAMRPVLARAAALIATADWEVERYPALLRLPAGRFVTIPNGSNLPAVDGSVATDGTLIVSIGRLERYKGHQRAIAALPHVLREVPDARLWIAGTGPYGSELADLARELGVADRVEIRAERDRDAYARQLAGASVATLLSEFETHPMAAVEAIALGVPMLVGRDGGGLSELANKRLASGVDLEGHAAEHAAQIVQLIDQPPQAPPVNLQSWDDTVDALLSLYAQILGRNAEKDGQA
ncbi:MAG: glycogen synthase [Solirubrobacteraceae bacterium]|jgi:glycosyltransferase involved in cell wall biosynthesis|nr:glycogen synthase [Solirubrobacteraceae bacterium]